MPEILTNIKNNDIFVLAHRPTWVSLPRAGTFVIPGGMLNESLGKSTRCQFVVAIEGWSAPNTVAADKDARIRTLKSFIVFLVSEFLEADNARTD